MGETTPSENEWLIMEVLWKCETPLTAAEIIENLKGTMHVSSKTIRVLINRLLKKGIIDYYVDEHDSRVYHYFTVKTKETCLEEKSERFLNSYFSGNPLGMVAALVQNEKFSQEQIDEMIQILESGKRQKMNKGKE